MSPLLWRKKVIYIQKCWTIPSTICLSLIGMEVFYMFVTISLTDVQSLKYKLARRNSFLESFALKPWWLVSNKRRENSTLFVPVTLCAHVQMFNINHLQVHSVQNRKHTRPLRKKEMQILLFWMHHSIAIYPIFNVITSRQTSSHRYYH